MHIRGARETDIPHMVAIAEAKRVGYEGYSPVFWRKAPDSSPTHERYLQSVLTSPDIIALVAQTGDSLVGFVIGALTTPHRSIIPAAWAIVTSGTHAIATMRLRHTHVPLPAVLITDEEVTRGKPAPDAYLLAATRLGVPAARCVVLEDAPAGIAAAQAAGMRVIAVTPTHAREHLRAAEAVVRGLHAVQVHVPSEPRGRRGVLTVVVNTAR